MSDADRWLSKGDATQVNPALAAADGSMDPMKAGDAFLACLAEVRYPAPWVWRDFKARVVAARWRAPVPEAVVKKAGALVGITFGEGDMWSVRLGDDQEPGTL